MADAIRDFVNLYLAGESTYPETLESLTPLIGSRRAFEVLRQAVENENDQYLSLLPVS